MSILRLVVGLGNPGEEYAGTRHNVGFDVVERIARDLGVRLGRFRGRFGAGKTLGEIGEDSGRGFALLEPTTYMNLSGSAVSAARDRFGIEPANILVICDDFHLDLARIRVRPNGSAGGHNGLKSIIGSLATDQFPRVRIGIGEVRGVTENFVLSKFNTAERKVISDTVETVAGHVARWCESGDLNRLMNALNAPAGEPPKSGGGGRGTRSGSEPHVE